MMLGAQQMNNNKNNLIVPDRKKLPYGGAEAVVLQHLIKPVDAFIAQASQEKCVQNLSLQEQFIEQYKHWIYPPQLTQSMGWTSLQ